MNKPSDFVNVQLSAAGMAFANGAPVRIATLHMNYTFAPGKPVRVLTSEWAKALSRETVKGLSIFELVPSAAADEQELKALEAQEASLKAQIAEEEK
jgi:hypothetical protein